MSETKVFSSIADLFDDMLGDINYKVDTMNLYPFKCRVGVIKYRPPRHTFFEYIINMGANDIQPILYHEEFGMPSQLTFVFPEAHMSVHEERSFMYQLSRHPQVGELQQMDLITKSPMMVGDFKADMIRVLTWPEDEKHVLPFLKIGSSVEELMDHG